jgi:hypothetical protein
MELNTMRYGGTGSLAELSSHDPTDVITEGEPENIRGAGDPQVIPWKHRPASVAALPAYSPDDRRYMSVSQTGR